MCSRQRLRVLLSRDTRSPPVLSFSPFPWFPCPNSWHISFFAILTICLTNLPILFIFYGVLLWPSKNGHPLFALLSLLCTFGYVNRCPHKNDPKGKKRPICRHHSRAAPHLVLVNIRPCNPSPGGGSRIHSI